MSEFEYHKFTCDGQVFVLPTYYNVINGIGSGSYGVVVKAYDSRHQEHVAIKKLQNVFHSGQSFSFYQRIYREIKILTHLDHMNVLGLLDVVRPKSYESFEDIYLVCELMDCDLHQIIQSNQVISDPQIQYIMFQILCGLNYIHSANILHRDLKPANILLNSDCQVKIADFGLSRSVDFSNNPFLSSPYVCTRWYRSPELLLCSNIATKAIDIWSAGCIFAELLGRRVLFPGNKQTGHQIDLICTIIGTPAEEDIRGCKQGIEFMKKLPIHKGIPFSTLYPNANYQALDLLTKMLQFNPEKRISAKDALQHPYFQKILAECDSETFESCPPFDYAKFERELQKNQGNLKALIYQAIMNWD